MADTKTNVKKVNKRRKLVWKIDFSKKKNKNGFIWFCILGGLAAIMLIQKLVYVIIGLQAQDKFLLFFAAICLVLDFFIGRRILLASQPD